MPWRIEVGLATGERALRVEEHLRFEPRDQQTIRRSRALLNVAGQCLYACAAFWRVVVTRPELQCSSCLGESADGGLRAGQDSGGLETLAGLSEDEGAPHDDEP